MKLRKIRLILAILIIATGVVLVGVSLWLAIASKSQGTITTVANGILSIANGLLIGGLVGTVLGFYFTSEDKGGE